jgi:hypothetical protein
MANNNPAGMGDNTTRLFNRVADDMRRFANNEHSYNNSNLSGDQWYNSPSKPKPNAERRTVKPHPTIRPELKPTVVSTPSPPNARQRVRRKPLR